MGLYRKYKTWKFECHLKKWGSKNVGYFQAFDKKWFEKNQIVLVWLCNHFIFKHWFRWILRINRDVKWDEYIVSLEPNNYKVFVGINGDKIELKADFRAHNKFSKRIYYAFKYMWWIAHAWDWLVADRFVPEWSFGLLTLTVHPNYDGEAGATSCDGYTARLAASEAFSVMNTGAGTYKDTAGISALVAYVKCSTTINEFAQITRSLYLFDTSSLGSGATIYTAKLHLYTYSVSNTLDDIDSEVVAVTPASNTALETADYSRFGTTSFCSKAYSSISGIGYHDYDLDSNGINAINLIGVSKYGLLSNWEFNNNFGGTWVSEGVSYVGTRTVDQEGTSEDPGLIITYTYYVNKFLGQEGFAKAIGVANVNVKKILGVE